MALKLGSKVKDSITKTTGIVMARAEYLYGCIWIEVEIGTLKTGPKTMWFDETRFVEVKTATKKAPKGKAKPKTMREAKRRYGPMVGPPSRSTPKTQ